MNSIPINRIFADLEDETPLAESAWYLKNSRSAARRWMEDLMPKDYPHIVYFIRNGDDEHWIVFLADWVEAHIKPTVAMVFYIDWYEYCGIDGVKKLQKDILDMQRTLATK